jgi:hypothetical protein
MALAAGRVDDARNLLEQAQVQLVFRPIGPSGEMTGTRSVAAGQVAEALSMLGAGDIPRAMQYIDLAMAQANNGPMGNVQAVTAMAPPRGGPPPPGYGYGYAPDAGYTPDYGRSRSGD